MLAIETTPNPHPTQTQHILRSYTYVFESLSRLAACCKYWHYFLLWETVSKFSLKEWNTILYEIIGIWTFKIRIHDGLFGVSHGWFCPSDSKNGLTRHCMCLMIIANHINMPLISFHFLYKYILRDHTQPVFHVISCAFHENGQIFHVSAMVDSAWSW